jgi:hypothetical protein
VSDVRPPDGSAGYRGALPPRNDWLARGWVVVVIVIFVGMFVLDILNVPTALFPPPSPIPSVSPAPSGSADASAEPSSGGSPSESEPEFPSPSPTP